MSKTYLIAQFNVANFQQWKSFFEQRSEVRKEAGLKDLHILRNMEDDNNITVLFEVDDLTKAKQHFSPENLQEILKAAHVVGEPKFIYLTS